MAFVSVMDPNAFARSVAQISRPAPRPAAAPPWAQPPPVAGCSWSLL